MSFDTITADEYKIILRNDLASFIQRSFHELNPQTPFVTGTYVDLLASTLERCRTGQTKRLIINLPPRTLKSHAASVAFPTWLLGHDPSAQIICASYGQDLADKHARDCRSVIESSFYYELFPGSRLSPDRRAVNDFMTTAQGCRLATSVGGPLTGRGADFVIIDDVMKPEEALSDSRRKAGNDWFCNTLLSRLNSKENGVIIIVMQRLHQNDLVGEVLENREWEILSLPAIAEQDECYPFSTVFGDFVYTRKAGEALHPERDSVETYLSIREIIGEYNFQSQYQQNPTTREGGLIKKHWLKYCEPSEWPQYFEYVLQSWDTAIKTDQRHDFSVCTTWGVLRGCLYLLDVYRKRMGFPELVKAVGEQFSKYANTEKVLIEDKGSGTSLLQELMYKGIWCLEAYFPKNTQDKEMRLEAQSIKFERGKVYLPAHAIWLEDYVRELTGFPGSKYDDQVDSTSQALAYLTRFL